MNVEYKDSSMRGYCAFCGLQLFTNSEIADTGNLGEGYCKKCSPKEEVYALFHKGCCNIIDQVENPNVVYTEEWVYRFCSRCGTPYEEDRMKVFDIITDLKKNGQQELSEAVLFRADRFYEINTQDDYILTE